MALGDPISVILGVLAGVDFFETDYPLDLASKNMALIFNPICENLTDSSLSLLRSRVSETLAKDAALMLAVECETKVPLTIDISKEIQGVRMS